MFIEVSLSGAQKHFEIFFLFIFPYYHLSPLYHLQSPPTSLTLITPLLSVSMSSFFFFSCLLNPPSPTPHFKYGMSKQVQSSFKVL